MTSDATGARVTQLFSEYGGRIYGYAYRRTPSPEEAQDVVADTYLITLRHIDRVPEYALPWLFAVARRVIANRSRAAAGEERTAAYLRTHSTPAPDAFEELAARERLRDAFCALSANDREALMLIEWDGLSNREAAEVMGSSTAAFAVRLHRARRRLARELQRDQGAADAQTSEVRR